MKSPLFTGSGVALVTPFCEHGVDYAKLEELLEYHLANHTDAVIVCGTTGERSTMPDEEHKEVIRFTVEKIAKRIPVIAGTGGNNTAYSVELSRHAESVGADGLLVVAPYYNKTTQKGLYAHVKAIADAVSVPLILYNIPSRTGGLGFSLETLKALDKLPNVTGIKESSGDLAFAVDIVANTDLAVYSGNDDLTVPILSVGGVGVISVVANILPQEVHAICAEYLAGDVTASRDRFLKILDLIHALFSEVNPIPIKTAMNLMGYGVGNLRLPLCEMSEENLCKLQDVLSAHHLLK